MSVVEETTLADAIKRGNPVCFLDITIGGAPVGRIELELFKASHPRTVENFRSLCTGEYRPSGLPVGYKGTPFHRIVPGFVVQGGDAAKGDGTGRLSIYGERFPDESLVMRHVAPGLLAMANSGPNSNACQFYITTGPAPHLDGKHVIFGRVLDRASMQTVRMIEGVPVGAGHRPSLEIRVAECGEL